MTGQQRQTRVNQASLMLCNQVALELFSMRCFDDEIMA